MLKTCLELQSVGREEGFAVGAFNTSNIEITRAIVNATVEKNSPAIIQCSKSAIKYGGLKNLVCIVNSFAEEHPGIPLALHLDHGPDFETCEMCIEAGFSSVMIDGSKLSLEENIAVTKKVVDFAHPKGISVEGELGKIGGTEDDVSVSEREASMTKVEDAVRFVKETGVDTLAVSIGNAHGVYKGEPKLDFDRLQEIKDAVTTPLVLHGASGIPAGDLKRATEIGVTKINIDTDIRLAFNKAVRKFVAEDEKAYDPRKIIGAGIPAMSEVVKGKIDNFGSADKASLY